MSHLATIGLNAFLSRLTMRSVLTDEEQQAILALPTVRVDVRAKHDFVQINEETKHSCLVVSGLVGRFGQLRNGLRQITALHVPGDMADIHSAVRPIGIGGLYACSNVTLLRIPHDAIRALAAAHPAIAEAFWRDCMLDAAVLMQWVVNVGRRDAVTRLAHVFCEMAVRCGQSNAIVDSYTFPITQEQLGDATALTGVHVNRSLKTLRDRELLTFKSQKVHIHDWKALAKVGEFDPAYLVADTAADRQTRLLAAAA